MAGWWADTWKIASKALIREAISLLQGDIPATQVTQCGTGEGWRPIHQRFCKGWTTQSRWRSTAPLSSGGFHLSWKMQFRRETISERTPPWSKVRLCRYMKHEKSVEIPRRKALQRYVTMPLSFPLSSFLEFKDSSASACGCRLELLPTTPPPISTVKPA